ncbi:hypothetical protein ACLBXO_16290 [Methylobacterium sp. C33D]
MAKKTKKGKVVRCNRTPSMVPPPCEREVGISAARVAQRLQQAREWRALCRQRAAARRRRELAFAALQEDLI